MDLHLDNTFGAIFIGVIMGAILYGVECVQVGYYFTHQKDTWPIKLLVSAVMIFETIHQALITNTLYTITITDWGNIAELDKFQSASLWTVLFEVLLTGFTAVFVQIFLAIRVWRLTSNNFLLASNRRIALTSVIALLVTGEFIGVVVIPTQLESGHFKAFTEIESLKALRVTILVSALAAAADVFIAATLCTILHFSRTGFHRTDTMINKLILFTVNTGLLTSICAVATLISASVVVAEDMPIFIAFLYCTGRLYTNSLLANLNARQMIRVAGEGTLTNFSVPLHESPMRPIQIDITTPEFAADSDLELDLRQSKTQAA